MQERIIIIGATSGIGRALAKAYLNRGHFVGITGRRLALLEELKQDYPNTCYYSSFDITSDDAPARLNALMQKIGKVDRVIVNAGIGNNNRSNLLQPDLKTIDTNVRGFSSMSMTAFQYFVEQGYGHLVGVSSVASYFGYGKAAAYTASKAFVSNYLSGLRHRAVLSKKKIYVTDIQPGFIKTPMIEKRKDVKGAISAEKMAEKVIPRLAKYQKMIIVPNRWKIAVLIMKLLPDSLLQRIS